VVETDFDCSCGCNRLNYSLASKTRTASSDTTSLSVRTLTFITNKSVLVKEIPDLFIT